MIHLVVPTGVSHFFTAQETEQRASEQYGLGLTQVQEGWFRDTAFTLHLQTNADVHFSRNFYKATRNANSSWQAFPHCFWTLSHADWYLLLSVANCPSASPFTNYLLWVPSSNSYLTGIPLPTFGRVESSSSGLFWFRAKKKQKDQLLGAPPS